MFNNLLFGQFLVEVGKTDKDTIYKALKKQQQEEYTRDLQTSHRLLGRILLEDYGVFENRVELQHYLEQFKEFKIYIERMRATLRQITGEQANSDGKK